MKKRRQRAVNETKRRIFKMLVVQTVFIVLATIGSYVFVDVMAKIAGTDSVNLTLIRHSYPDVRGPRTAQLHHVQIRI